MTRGRIWFEQLTLNAPWVAGFPPSLLVADAELDGRAVRAISVVPNPDAQFERARNGEVGIDEGYGIARAVDETPPGSAILAIVDVPGQAFGRREEELGIQCALAAAVEAYATKRRAGTPVAAIIVGKAISGAFLAHGMQAGWIGALRDGQLEVHVMSAPAVARVTLMAPADIERLAREIPATSREIERFATFGAIDAIVDVANADSPLPQDVDRVARAIAGALADPLLGLRNPSQRLETLQARKTRALSRAVRERIDAEWNA